MRIIPLVLAFAWLAVIGAQADNLLKNGDFAQGKEAWNGDGSAVIGDSSSDPFDGTPDSGHRLTINLRSAEWSKVSQDFPVLPGPLLVSVTYSVSSDFELSSRAEDYANVLSSLDLPATGDSATARPGGWMTLLIEPVARSVRWSETGAPPASSSGIRSTFRLSSQSNGTVTLMLAFPPGHGAVTLQEVMLQPETVANDPFAEGLRFIGERKWTEAIGCFDQVIQADSKNIRAYQRRAYAKEMKGDLDGAIADDTAMISIDPKLAIAYAARGYVKGEKYDSAGAIADYDAALELDPHSAVSYLNRGNEKLYAMNADGALADYTSAIAEKADNPLYYKMRGYADFLKGLQAPSDATWQQKARDDSMQCEKLQAEDRDYYPHFLTYLIDSAQLGQVDSARQDLATFLHSRAGNPYPWGQQLGSYLTGQLPEDQLLKAALTARNSWQVGHQNCEAFYYIGTQHLQSGDKAGAIGYFQQTVQTKHTRMVEYVLAKALLQQLQPTPVPAQ